MSQTNNLPTNQENLAPLSNQQVNQRQNLQSYNFSLLHRTIHNQQEEIRTILQTPVLPRPDIDERQKDYLFKAFKEKNVFVDFTGFTELEILDIFQDMQQFVPRFSKRGAKPSVSMLDSLIAYMALFKSGSDYIKLGHDFHIAPSTLQAAIDRVHSLLEKTIEHRWISSRIRPDPLLQTNHPYIALAADVVSVKIPHPKMQFDDAMVFYDGKNHKYSLKKECAVRTAPPHYCLFIQKGEPGSVHDYTILKNSYSSYLQYLNKSPTERQQLPTDFENRSWGIVFDSGYIGPANDTPGLRRLTVPRNPSSLASSTLSTELSHIRVVVEQFFGRFYALWGLFRLKYKFDQINFDTDFKICAFLTNEHIKRSDTTEMDKKFYDLLIQAEQKKFEEKQAKRSAIYERSKQRKRKHMEMEDLLAQVQSANHLFAT